MVDPSTKPWTLAARWIFPVDRPPLEGGAITISGDQILAVEPTGRTKPDVDLGNKAILPGFVNAHTHLDLSGMKGHLSPTGDFPGWLKAVVQFRRTHPVMDIAKDIESGLDESLSFGTTLIGDISSGGQSWSQLNSGPIRALVFYEILGLPRERAEKAWHEAKTWVEAHPATATCKPGLSPHAPYSVRASLFRLTAAFATQNPVALAIHLAESSDEGLLLETKAGPFIDFLQGLGAWDPDGLVGNWQEVLNSYGKTKNVSWVHGNYLDPSYSFPAGSTVIYCPRTHAAFGHPPHPFEKLIAKGVRVALGTDSLASNPDLDILAEARFIHHRFPNFSGFELLKMATLAGAEALGWENQTGSLTPGKSADFIVLSLVEEKTPDPHWLIFQSNSPVSAVFFRGEIVRGESLLQK